MRSLIVGAVCAMMAPAMAADTEGADKAVATVLDQALAQLASQAANRAEDAAKRVEAAHNDVEAAERDEESSCHDADVIASERETAIALEVFRRRQSDTPFERRQSDTDPFTVPFRDEFTRADEACKRALDEFGRAVRGEQ